MLILNVFKSNVCSLEQVGLVLMFLYARKKKAEIIKERDQNSLRDKKNNFAVDSIVIVQIFAIAQLIVFLASSMFPYS